MITLLISTAFSFLEIIESDTEASVENRERDHLSSFPSSPALHYDFSSTPSLTSLPLSPDPLSRSSVGEGYFTENIGQFDNTDVHFAYFGVSYSMGFCESGYLVYLKGENGLWSMLLVSFPGSNRIIPKGMDELYQKSNYLRGGDPAHWKTEVACYREVIYENLYPGVDLVFSFSDREVKYDFILSSAPDPKDAPTDSILTHSSPGDITIRYDGAKELFLDPAGNLHIATESSELIEEKPQSFQANAEISTNFIINGNEATFELGDFDPGLPLVIDPLIYSSYLGGSESDNAMAMCMDNEGNVYLTGDTYSGNFPISEGAYDDSFNGVRDIFVFKLSSDGSEMIYSTFIGGNDNDVPHGITLDAEGNVYVTGRSESPDFPTTTGAYDEVQNGDSDVVVFKLNNDGSDLVYSTFVGGNQYEVGYAGIAIDEEGNTYVAGHTNSPDFPTTAGAYDRTYYCCGWDGFAFKLNSDGSELQYSTYFGGWDYEGARSIAVDDQGNIYLGGDTTSNDFPTTTGAYDEVHNGGRDGFLMELNNDGSDLIFSTYLGGADTDLVNGLELLPGNSVWLTGYTLSSDFPTTTGAYDEDLDGERAFFVSQFSADGSDLPYSTYIGGSEQDEGQDIIVEGDLVYVAGRTYSVDFPVTGDALYSENSGGMDGIILTLDSGRTGEEQLAYSTYIGGSQNEAIWGIQMHEGIICAAGLTASDNFPVTGNAFDGDYNGGSIDAIMFKLGFSEEPENTPPTLTITSPANHSDVSGIVRIDGTASDLEGNETIERVEMTLRSTGSEDWQSVSGTTSWSYDWDTTGVEDGTHILGFRGYDGENHSEIREITLEVLNTQQENRKPVIIIESPANHSEGSGTITISGTASDEDDNEAIETVEVSVSGGDWEEVSGTTSWSFEWDTTYMVDGDYSLGFRAFDGDDYSEVEEIILTVRNEQASPGNIIPTIVINHPINQTEVSKTIMISGTASDEDGEVVSMEISINNGSWIEGVGSESWSFQLDTNTLENGLIPIRVRSYDGINYSVVHQVYVQVRNSEDDGDDDEFVVADMDGYIFFLGVVLIVAVVIGIVLTMGRRGKGEETAACPVCGSPGEYSEEYVDHYCWTCEGYFEDMQ